MPTPPILPAAPGFQYQSGLPFSCLLSGDKSGITLDGVPQAAKKDADMTIIINREYGRREARERVPPPKKPPQAFRDGFCE